MLVQFKSFWSPRPARHGIHYGQDFATPTGSTLLAPYDGVITGIQAPTSSAYADITIERRDLNGNLVQVKYGFIGQVSVSVGQTVQAGSYYCTIGW